MTTTRHGWLVPTVPAAVAAAVAAPGIGRMVLSQDEAATLSAVSRSVPDLVRLSSHVDGVLAGYYLLMRAWTAVVGTSPVALRVPSLLAAAAAAAVVAVLAARLLDPWAGVLAGLVVAVCPAVTDHAREARPYTLTVLLAALVTWQLVRALETPSWWRWAWWGAGLVVLGATQLTAMLLLPAHLVVVLVRRPRVPWRRPLAVAAVALVVLLPVGYVGHRQRGAVGWIPETTWRAVWTLPAGVVASWVFAAAVVAVGVAGVVVRRRLVPTAVLGLAIAVVPAVLLVVVSFALPLLRPRYLLFTVVGWALFAAAAVCGRRAAAVAAAVVVVAGALPGQVAQWSPTLPGQPDTRAMARILAAEARPGDAIVVPTDRGRRVRVRLAAYLPEGARPPRDVLVVTGAAAAGSLDARECRPAVCLDAPARLWVACAGTCGSPLTSLRPETVRAIRSRGYHPCRTWRVPEGALSLLAAAGLSCGSGP